jgi:hypothetical protein
MNFLVLDEPANHPVIRAIAHFGQALAAYSRALVPVTRDDGWLAHSVPLKRSTSRRARNDSALISVCMAYRANRAPTMSGRPGTQIY